MDRETEHTFVKEDCKWPINKYKKRYSVSLGIKEMQIKVTIRKHLLEWLLAKRQEKTNVGEDVEKGNLRTVFVEIGENTIENYMRWRFLKKLISNHTSGCILEGN